MEKPLHTVVETNAFLTTARRIGLSDDERAAIVNQVAAAPQDGDLVQGSGGVRKIRFAGSGGYRVMVAYLGAESPAYLLGVLSKTARATFTDAEINAMHSLTKAIKQARKAARDR
ncbi:type II toxin-antitoxin system RelE/ParE family toxin [Methylobacterium mesophilicum]|uniref:type II toxin-antitoxin system RelE/ParE family toxin n=2 Tax=Methylobacterium mesophilicum TaxID=39956 RepID=UPI001EE28A13|nr:type II toxin-antitoxin system RelE/ParE family toxin [Methylobacterium mesophilicum]GJE23343.1 hypothetical protein JHFBIEKO_3805 [Methylobacterium mesophilicum]